MQIVNYYRENCFLKEFHLLEWERHRATSSAFQLKEQKIEQLQQQLAVNPDLP